MTYSPIVNVQRMVRGGMDAPLAPLVDVSELPKYLDLSLDDVRALVAFGMFRPAWYHGFGAFDPECCRRLLQNHTRETLEPAIVEGRRTIRLRDPQNAWMKSQIEDAKRFPHHHIYFVRCGAFVKIGHSGSVAFRMKTMRTGNPYELELLALLRGHEETERALHEMFRRQHHRDEWFKLTKPIKEFVDAYCSKDGLNFVLGADRVEGLRPVRLAAPVRRAG